MSQFSENLLEAGLVSRANNCQRPASLYNEHSGQDELLKAVLLAGLYPNLIQVCLLIFLLKLADEMEILEQIEGSSDVSCIFIDTHC